MVQRDPVQGIIITFVKRWLLFNSPSSKSVTMISDDPLAVGRGRVPLIFNKCLALPGTYLAEKLESICGIIPDFYIIQTSILTAPGSLS